MSKNFILSDVEVETLRRACDDRKLTFDANKREYSKEELHEFGLVREAYTKEELIERGFHSQKINSFDDKAKKAKELLKVDTPFAKGIEK